MANAASQAMSNSALRCFVLVLAACSKPDQASESDENEALTRAAVTAAQALFPAAKAVTRCQEFGRTRQVRLASFRVSTGKVNFQVVDPLMVQRKEGWVAAGFEDLPGFADKVRAEPLVRRVVGEDDPLSCLSSPDAPGATTYLLCSLRPLGMVVVPTSGSLQDGHTQFEFAVNPSPPRDCACPTFRLINYAIPLSQLPDNAPGWCVVKSRPTVAQFLASHAVAWVTVTNWQGYVVKLRATDGSVLEEPLPSSECRCEGPPACDATNAPKR